MNYVYPSAITAILSSTMNFFDGIAFDLVCKPLTDFTTPVFITDIAADARLQIPHVVAVSVVGTAVTTTPNPNDRVAVFAAADTIPLYGIIAYAQYDGRLLFCIDFGDIRHAVGGAFSFVYPRDLVTILPRET